MQPATMGRLAIGLNTLANTWQHGQLQRIVSLCKGGSDARCTSLICDCRQRVD